MATAAAEAMAGIDPPRPVPDPGLEALAGAGPHLPRPVTPLALLEWAATIPGLLVEWTTLPGRSARYSAGFPGLGGGVIQVDRRLRGPELTCVLAEELGHHATLAVQAARLGASSRRIIVSRNEVRALRWAARVLVPEGELLAAERPGDLAERWLVTPEFAERAVEAARRAMPSWWVPGRPPSAPLSH